ncbi:hypothetical protein BU23DRAFT_463103 [Bimuria novae-zelandiae CBS 107.79]|uniref:LCCL domain-containing protein n=1 Tax=Bimuria novae-zelandiae CBS 107.79 TaxID=1447943 RepID=A0A6A5VA16_9PLEO|nr:hypothetical protein BU23DRAFT_463103 [Bimuria novae-zelandiae CBS 107.79]
MDHDIEPAHPPHADSRQSSKHPLSTAQSNIISSNTGWGIDPTPPSEKKWRESPGWKGFKSKVPQPLARRAIRVWSWLKGDDSPQANRIIPFFENIQTFHTRQFARLPKLARACVFVCTFMLWLVIFGVILSKDSLPKNIAGFGAPVRLACAARLWPNAQSCGLDGRNCLPFDNTSFAFACPAGCAGVQVLNPYAIGNESIVYRPLIIGGAPDRSESNDPIYRGDSFICGAAIQAGVLTDGSGGCGVVRLVGQKTDYGANSQNGMSSVGFQSSFPMSFAFNQSDSVQRTSAKCHDPRWDLLALSTVFTAVFSLFTTHPATFFGLIFVIVFWQVAMASDPPSYSTYPSLASTALANFLPAAFVAVIIYKISVRRTLDHLRAHYEKTVLWVGGLWVGALNNLTFDMIPISRLTSHDLKQQPGAMTALIIIILVLVGAALYQAWCFRVEGRLPRYLGIYAVLGICLLILLAVPSLDLRIHHYILALLLLPGTATQTRPSLLFQGILVGLFINGVARWGFASILQTAAALRGDAQLGSGLPSLLEPVINSTNITFAWHGLIRGYDGVSVLVNDVERFRGNQDDMGFTWTRRAVDHPEFFRFGFVNYQPFGGISYSDFTRAGTWWANGTWEMPPLGRT